MQTATGVQQSSITIFDVSDRFYMCRRKLDDFGEYLEAVSEKDHPGVIELLAQFSALRAISNRASAKFEKVDGHGEREIKARELKLILNLEIVIHEFESVIHEAHNELTAS